MQGNTGNSANSEKLHRTTNRRKDVRSTRRRAHGVCWRGDISCPRRRGRACQWAAQADPDDVLDAAAAAWSAHRVATGVAGSMPDPPQVNERGQRVAKWF
jgi:predicted RNase H-like nuclease